MQREDGYYSNIENLVLWARILYSYETIIQKPITTDLVIYYENSSFFGHYQAL